MHPLALWALVLAGAPSYLVVEGPSSSGVCGLALVDEEFQGIAKADLGGRLEFAVSPDRERIAAAWMDLEGRTFSQVFDSRTLATACARTPIAHYATNTTGFWNPIVWKDDSAFLVEFVVTPRATPDERFDRFYAQVFRVPERSDRPLALQPGCAERIQLPPDNTHVLGIHGGDVVVLDSTIHLRTVNLATGAMGAALEIRPPGQDGLEESPMGWCAADDSTLLLFGFSGVVKEIRFGPGPKIAREIPLVGLPPGAHVGPDGVRRDPLRSDRVLIATEYLDRPGSLEIRALQDLALVGSKERDRREGFAPGRDGTVLLWTLGDTADIDVLSAAATKRHRFDAPVGAIVALR